MAGAAELLEPLRGALVPVPAVPQEGVCSICHSSAEGFGTCFPCHRAAALDPPEVIPITLSVEGGLVHRHLRMYKDGREPERSRMALRLAALLSVFLSYHENCLGPFDYCAVVPSETRVALERVVRRVGALGPRLRQVVQAQPLRRGTHVLSPDRFRISAGVTGDRVLLLDDTFTTGASVFSAARALRDAGAVLAGPLVLGRHVSDDWKPSAELLDWVQRRPWRADRCARCDGERQDERRLL